MADETTPESNPVPEIVVPDFSFRTITTEEFRANLDKREGTPWPVVFDNGVWRGGEPTGEIAVYMVDWNGGLPFVIDASILAGGVRLKMLADADGKLLGTEEAPQEQEKKPDEIQDGGGLRGVPPADQGDASGDEEGEKEAPQATGNPTVEQRSTGL